MRVIWSLSGCSSGRVSWTVLDRAQDTRPLEQPLSDQITRMELRYLTEKDVWLPQWPNPAEVVVGGPPPESLPRAVEITLEHKQYGELVWLFRMPDP